MKMSKCHDYHNQRNRSNKPKFNKARRKDRFDNK